MLITNNLNRIILSLMACGFFFASSAVYANSVDNQVAFRVNGKPTTMKDIRKTDQSAFYDIEKKKFELIEGIARQKYLDQFFGDQAKKGKTTVEQARKDYLKKNVKVSDAEIKETMERFKDHPQLSKLSDAEKRQQIKDFLSSQQEREVLDGIVEAGLSKGALKIEYPRPEEPIYEIEVVKTDHVRYGPNPEDTKPVKCKGNDCSITVVEYSEFQCPFCSRVLPSVKRLMTEYKGQIRWIVRDFPLSFHNRAKPAAVAARCAGDQGKYWFMYNKLFDNQRALEDKDFEKYAKEIKLDMKKFKACTEKPGEHLAIIDSNMESGAKVGVTGTPAYFINGRRLSGALPYSTFKKVIEEEMKKGKQS